MHNTEKEDIVTSKLKLPIKSYVYYYNHVVSKKASLKFGSCIPVDSMEMGQKKASILKGTLKLKQKSTHMIPNGVIISIVFFPIIHCRVC